jgi:hypothetical protein
MFVRFHRLQTCSVLFSSVALALLCLHSSIAHSSAECQSRHPVRDCNIAPGCREARAGMRRFGFPLAARAPRHSQFALKFYF